jgi:hypothetical protein
VSFHGALPTEPVSTKPINCSCPDCVAENLGKPHLMRFGSASLYN